MWAAIKVLLSRMRRLTMKRRVLFLLALLALLFAACSDVAQGADSSATSNQVAENAIMEARTAVSAAETAINTESPDIAALKQAVAALMAATEKLSAALGTPSPDIAALHKEIENVRNTVDAVEKKISELEPQKPEEPTPPKDEEQKDEPADEPKGDDEPKTNPPQEKKEPEQQDDPNPQQQSEATDYSTGKHTLFAKGISKDDTRYDVNKTWGDSQLCWAATSSNLIAWWQDLYTQNGKLLPSFATKEANSIFELFKLYFNNTNDNTGTFVNGLQWYFGATSQTAATSKNDARGGFLYNTGLTSWNPYAPTAYNLKYENDLNTLQKFSDFAIANLQKQAAAGLKMHKPYDHAITLWGADVENNIVTAVYVTDSDDKVTKMQRYEIGYEGTNVVLKNYDTGRSATVTGLMFLYPPRASK